MTPPPPDRPPLVLRVLFAPFAAYDGATARASAWLRGRGAPAAAVGIAHVRAALARAHDRWRGPRPSAADLRAIASAPTGPAGPWTAAAVRRLLRLGGAEAAYLLAANPAITGGAAQPLRDEGARRLRFAGWYPAVVAGARTADLLRALALRGELPATHRVMRRLWELAAPNTLGEPANRVAVYTVIAAHAATPDRLLDAILAADDLGPAVQPAQIDALATRCRRAAPEAVRAAWQALVDARAARLAVRLLRDELSPAQRAQITRADLLPLMRRPDLELRRLVVAALHRAGPAVDADGPAAPDVPDAPDAPDAPEPRAPSDRPDRVSWVAAPAAGSVPPGAAPASAVSPAAPSTARPCPTPSAPSLTPSASRPRARR